MNKEEAIVLTPEEKQKLDKKKNQIDDLKFHLSDLYWIDYHLYAITLTYKTINNQDHHPDFLRKIFRGFYWDSFLPKYIFNDDNWIYKKKSDQPYVYAFTEPHEGSCVKVSIPTSDSGTGFNFPERYHHHLIMAVKNEHKEKMDALLGQNTLRPFSNMIMTSDVQKYDSNWVDYAMKAYERNQDGLIVYGPVR